MDRPAAYLQALCRSGAVSRVESRRPRIVEPLDPCLVVHFMADSKVPAEMRPGRKILRAVLDLHTRGFQRIRIAPYLYDLGTWRCLVAPASWISREHGAKLAEGVRWEDTAHYTSAAGREYWGWRDSHRCSPARLAEVFLERFPKIAELGYGEDWAYCGWYQHMLHVTYPDALPIAFSDWEPVVGHMATVGREVKFTLPPVGLATSP